MKWLMVLLLAAPAAAQERADAPFSWARHKPGTLLKTRMTMFGTTVEHIRTLKAVTDTEVIFNLVTISGKDRKEEEQKLPLYRLGKESLGEEILRFKDRDYKCKIMPGTFDIGEAKVETKYWIAEGVDFPLKTVEVSKGPKAWMNVETESLLDGLEEELIVAGRKLKCARYKASMKGAKTATISAWMCADIPGGGARSEVELETREGKKTKMVVETLEFEVKK